MNGDCLAWVFDPSLKLCWLKNLVPEKQVGQRKRDEKPKACKREKGEKYNRGREFFLAQFSGKKFPSLIKPSSRCSYDKVSDVAENQVQFARRTLRYHSTAVRALV